MSPKALGRLRGRPGRHQAVVRCEDAQEAISARLDGERLLFPRPALDAHLVSCQACRDFEAGAVALGRQVRLRAPRPAPEDLLATLVPLLEPVGRSVFASVRQRRLDTGSRFSPVHAAGWAATTVPATLAAVAISLGVGTHPHMVPTRPPSPCTIGLIPRHLQHGG